MNADGPLARLAAVWPEVAPLGQLRRPVHVMRAVAAVIEDRAPATVAPHEIHTTVDAPTLAIKAALSCLVREGYVAVNYDVDHERLSVQTLGYRYRNPFRPGGAS